METKAILRGVRLSAQKGRLVADLVRGMPVGRALDTLAFSPKKGAKIIRKVLESAIANARVKADKDGEYLDEQDLYVANAYVDEGTTLKRFRPRAQGRAFQIKKRTSHITIVLATPSEADVEKAAGKSTAAKAGKK